MKILKADGLYFIHSDDIETYDMLPEGTYRVIETREGLRLTRVPDLGGDVTVYGDSGERARAIVESYIDSGSRMGVILTGPVGLGKTLFARTMSWMLRQEGIPTVIVDHLPDGIFSFLASLDQPCMVLFDEFDKIEEMCDDPAQELGYFDGTSTARHLDVITANAATDRMSRFMGNRPGRFRWNVRFDYPSESAMVEYLADHGVFGDAMDDVMRLNDVVPLNYDMLDAIVSELGRGRSLADFIDDMNILPNGTRHVRIQYVAECNGKRYSGTEYAMVTGRMFTFTVRIPGGDFVYADVPSSVPMDGSPIDPKVVTGAFDDGETHAYSDGESVVRLISLRVERGVNVMRLSDTLRGESDE